MKLPHSTLMFAGLDDRPPFLDLGLLQGAQRLRRLLLAREDFLAGSASLARVAGSASASTTAALSLSMIGFGVPLGTQSPCQSEM